MLTGCRKTEIMTLRWEHVDLDRAEMRIVNGKTGDRTGHLSPSAVSVLATLPRQSDNPWVVPGAKPGTHMADTDGAWQSIRARAGLHDVRIHDNRHSCATRPNLYEISSDFWNCEFLYTTVLEGVSRNSPESHQPA